MKVISRGKPAVYLSTRRTGTAAAGTQYLYGGRGLQRLGEADHAHVVGVLPQRRRVGRAAGAAAEQARQAQRLAAHAAAHVPAVQHAVARFAPVLLRKQMSHSQLIFTQKEKKS